MATDCLRLRTLAPDEDFRLPCLYSRMTLLIFLPPDPGAFLIRISSGNRPFSTVAPMIERVALELNRPTPIAIELKRSPDDLLVTAFRAPEDVGLVMFPLRARLAPGRLVRL